MQGEGWSQARVSGASAWQRAEASLAGPPWRSHQPPSCSVFFPSCIFWPSSSASLSQSSLTPACVSSLQERLAGVSLSLFFPLSTPLRPAPSPPSRARPAFKPSEATSVLNPKSCQLNCSLRLRRLLLTSREASERGRRLRGWGGERRRPPPGPGRSSVCPSVRLRP